VYEISYAVSVQTDGKIISSGCTYNGVDDDFALVRYNANGTLDNSFDGDGIVVTPLGADDWIFGMVLQTDGKSIVGGYTQNGVVSDFALVRYNTNGSLDTSFDSDGIVITDFSSDDMAYGIALQPDLKIVAAGYAYNGTDEDFALARYISGLNVGVVEFSMDPQVLIYPNPVISSAILKYTLTDPEEISIKLLNMQGEIVQVITTNQMHEAGEHQQQILLFYCDIFSPWKYTYKNIEVEIILQPGRLLQHGYFFCFLHRTIF
jgi:uncharacterized delta-60 repeat protein